MRLLLLTLLALSGNTPPSHPEGKAGRPIAAETRPFWGVTGHRVVARIASDRLTPAAKAEVERLLGTESLADVANWADQIRNSRPATAPWHYVDIPVLDSGYVAKRDCLPTCIIPVIDSLTIVLTDRARSVGQRAEALRFLVHFIGDLHQPLHASDRGDRGGNDVKVQFLGRQYTLHSVWDTQLITAMGMTEDALVDEIERQIAKRNDIADVARGATVAWAMESHDVARDFIYRNLPNSLVLGPDALAAARPVVEDRLLRGGVRLAAVLNKALGQ